MYENVMEQKHNPNMSCNFFYTNIYTNIYYYSNCFDAHFFTLGYKKNEPDSSMVLHPGFEPTCLNPYTLQNIYNIYRSDSGRIRGRTSEE